jgi:hypothetical protein
VFQASLKLAMYENILKELSAEIQLSIDRSAPYFGDGGDGGVFSNSYDWHSSVHAHWAALSIARVTMDSEAQKRILSRLSKDALLREQRRLNENPGFEMPYGRAWLLLLLHEIKQHSSAEQMWLTSFKDTLTENVIDWLERAPASGGRACNGSYDSWVFAYLLLRESRPSAKFAGAQSALAKSIESRGCRNQVATGNDFVNPASLYAYIHGSTEAPTLDPLPEGGVIDLSNCHRLGVELSQLWPLAKGNAQERARFRESLTEFLSSPARWKGDFVTTSHWIPQFVWFGIWSTLGNP